MAEARDFDVGALHRALDDERQAQAMTWAGVSRAISTRPTGRVSASTITGIRGKRSVEADGVLQMLRWLDRTPESFCGARDEALSAHLGAIPSGMTLRFDAKAIHAAVDAKRTPAGATWENVAREIGGCSASSLTKMAKGGRVAFPQVMRVIRWTGEHSTGFMRITDW